jgi:protocatechuate 3,4-dioxygenase beta subunit
MLALVLLALPCLISAQSERQSERPSERIETTTTPIMPMSTIDRQRRSTTDDKPPSSKLRGRVVYDDTGRPVRRARVLLLEDGSTTGTGQGALTNAQGEFEIEQVAAGRYFIIVEGPGLLTPYSFLNVEGQTDNDIDFNAFRTQFETVTVDGRSEARVEVRARRGGSITGRVTYDNGDPAINVRVTLLRRQKGRVREYMGGVGSESSGTVPTDDRGIYRFAGLPPGEYLVSVAEQIMHGDGSTGDGDEGEGDAPSAVNGGTPLVVTYYPAAVTIKEAGAIKLEASEEHAGVDITLVERALYTLAGVVRDRKTGQAVTGVHLGIHLQEGEAEEMPLNVDHNTETDEQGHWQFNELPDGRYVLRIQPQPQIDPAALETYQRTLRAAVEAHDMAVMQTARVPSPVQKFAAKQQHVTIEGHDLTNLSVELSAGGYIAGTVSVEGNKPLPPYLGIYAETAGDGQHEHDTTTTTAQNGHFIIGGIQPGKVYLNINASSEAGYYVKSITVNGTTYTNEQPLSIEDGAVIKGARLLLSTEAATLSGHVRTADKDGKPVGGAAVVLVAADARRWSWSGLQTLESTNLDGTFEATVPPGDYLVFMLPADERPRTLTEDEIKRFSVGAQHVSLRAGKTEQLELIAPNDR